MSEEAKYEFVVKSSPSVKELATEFVSLVFPRMTAQFAENTQAQIEGIKNLRKGDTHLKSELSKHQVRLQKMLKAETQQKVFDKMVDLLAENLTEFELSQAIFHEKLTMKIMGIAAQLDTAFEEAVGED